MRTELVFTDHAVDVLKEREIPEEWVWSAIESADRKEIGSDGNTHYIKAIAQHGDRLLRVVVNQNVTPQRIVTVFFDRRLRRRT